MLKPVFVPKARRETAVERAKLEKEEKEKELKRNIEKVTNCPDAAVGGVGMRIFRIPA